MAQNENGLMYDADVKINLHYIAHVDLQVG